ncbi:hypothetical protein [Roseomonas xinghualingensis]|nr:hypothetical protein [Roseomonas sp. SXEYE001]MCV4206055.1 hypothetical protein [Roseomonas sp. SXEYE001]
MTLLGVEAELPLDRISLLQAVPVSRHAASISFGTEVFMAPLFPDYAYRA